MGAVHFIGAFFIFSAVVLLTITSVSVPVWKQVYFLKATLAEPVGNLAAGEFKMGVWGYCVGNVCSRSTLGYNVDFLAATSGNSNITLLRNLTYALLLNPIAGGLALLALVFSFSSHFIMGVVASVLSIFAFLVTIAALGVDLGLAITAKRRLENLNAGNSAMLGYANWFVAGAALALLLASVTVCCTSTRARRQRKLDNDVHQAGQHDSYAPPERSSYGGNAGYDNNTYNSRPMSSHSHGPATSRPYSAVGQDQAYVGGPTYNVDGYKDTSVQGHHRSNSRY